MKKQVKSLMILGVIALMASCSTTPATSSSTPTSSSSSTSSEVSTSPEENSSVDSSSAELDAPTAAQALEILNAVSFDDIRSYSITTRRYQYNSYTQAVVTNLQEIDSFTMFTDNVQGTAEVEYYTTGVASPTLESSYSGIFTSYALVDDYYTSAFVMDLSSLSSYTIKQNTRYYDMFDNVDSYTGYKDLVVTGLTSPSTYYPSESGWTVSDEPVITETDEGYVVSVDATAEAEGYYSAEDSGVSLTLSKKDYSIISLNWYDRTFNGERVEDLETGTNGYRCVTISDIEIAERDEEEPYVIDPNKTGITVSGSILSKPSLSSGDLKPSDAAAVLSNLYLYTTDTVSTDYTVVSESTGTDGSAVTSTTTGQRVAYNNDITIDNATTTTTGSDETSTTLIQAVGVEDGIEYVYQSTAGGYQTLVPASSLTTAASVDYYLGASGYNISGNVSAICRETANEGFGTYKGVYATYERKLISATYTDGVISISFDANMFISIGTYSSNMYMRVELTIEDDFLSKIVYSSGTEEEVFTSVSTYNMTAGEKSDFTGDLVEYEG